ncbi:MAG TPA: hypothetical protein VFD39_07515 [Trueperaceae bacterium]|nr:hypothetical protein [Trueperaceae bacterium]
MSLLLLSVACNQVGDPDPPGGEVEPPVAPTLGLEPTAIKSFSFTWADVANETEYRLLEDPDGASGFSPVATLPADSESHDLLVFLPAKVNARYVLEACNDGGCGTSEPVEVGPELVEAIGYVKASNTGANDTFGWSLALSADGATLAVGAPNEDSSATEVGGDQTNDGLVNSGAVYVFTRTVDGGWSQDAYLKAWNTGAGDLFGWTVELSADGGTLAVGAPGEDSGAAYVFTRTATGVWSQQAYVKASNSDEGDVFGVSLDVSADGSTLAVGAIGEASAAKGVGGDQSDDSAARAGAVYVFARSSVGVWSQDAYLKASNASADDEFGWQVALAADGGTLAISAKGERSFATGVNGDQDDVNAFNAGAVFVVDRTPDDWLQTAYVKASNTGQGDEFGYSVGLSADGDTLAVGAIGEASQATGIGGDQNDGSVIGAGAVYLY